MKSLVRTLLAASAALLFGVAGLVVAAPASAAARHEVTGFGTVR